MAVLSSGSILRIPLLHNMGYAYAKYIDLNKLSKEVSLAEIIKVYDFKSLEKINDVESLTLSDYLISPIAVSGLRPTIKKGFWINIGKEELSESDLILPDFKGFHSYDDSIKRDEWFIYKEAKLSNKERSIYDKVKYLQPFGASGTGNIEIRLTMYFLLKEGKKVEDYFYLNDESYRWLYNITRECPALNWEP